MRLFIEPTEPLMFRTGRPFDAGQNTFAESMFPPTPETLQGAVRATIATYWHSRKNIAAAFDDPELTKLIGDRNGYGRFRVTGIALGRYDKAQPEKIERLFPSPAHIMKTDEGKRLFRLLPRPREETIRSNLPEGVRHYLEPTEAPDDDLKPVEGWLTETSLYKALGTDALTGIEIIPKDDICQEEPRLGIGIQRGTKATEEGYLYQVLMIRMNHKMNHDSTYGFVADIDLAPLSSGDEPLHDAQIQQKLHMPASGWICYPPLSRQKSTNFKNELSHIASGCAS